jgi:asparagine synthase (glutamine-hydrolysing)
MCGIAGILGRLGEGNRAALDRMSQSMTHRGPDARGTWESTADVAGRGVMLTHRRLSILDLSPAGAQPMVDPSSGSVIVYNGEVYNFVELRSALVAAGEAFQSTGDTEVVLREVCRKGPAALPALRGMFALAFWDPAARTLLLARDPLGMKPLYVAVNPDPGAEWSLAFASEVRSLLASGLLGRPRLDPDAVASVLWNGFVVGPGTAVAGISSLRPGELRVLDVEGREHVARDFWSAGPRSGRRAVGVAAVEAAVEESVRLHLASDVPLAVFLSGGVDSSAIANLACRVSTTPVHTFTLAFEEEAWDEGRIARRVSDALGTSHRQVVLTEGDFLRNLEPAMASLDQPTFDGLNAYYMSRAVREAGFTVALTSRSSCAWRAGRAGSPHDGRLSWQVRRQPRWNPAEGTCRDRPGGQSWGP